MKLIGMCCQVGAGFKPAPTKCYYVLRQVRTPDDTIFVFTSESYNVILKKHINLREIFAIFLKINYSIIDSMIKPAFDSA